MRWLYIGVILLFVGFLIPVVFVVLASLLSAQWLVTAIAPVAQTCAIAGAGFVALCYALETRRMAEATRTMAEATNVQAQATNVLAQASSMPLLILTWDTKENLPVLVNIGPGPALNVWMWADCLGDREPIKLTDGVGGNGKDGRLLGHCALKKAKAQGSVVHIHYCDVAGKESDLLRIWGEDPGGWREPSDDQLQAHKDAGCPFCTANERTSKDKPLWKCTKP